MSQSEDEFDKDQLSDDARWNYVPRPPGTGLESAAALHNPGHRLTPWKRSREPQPPWKRSKGHGPFAGGVTISELHHKALARNRGSKPPAPRKKYGIAVPLVGAMLIAVGIAGYKLGFGLTGLISEELAPTEAVKSAPLSSGLPAPDAAVVSGSAPALANAPPTSSDPRQLDPRDLAAKMKIGVRLMTYGEITAARVMFQRAAEAGDGAGAFALAETYDPLVLAGLRLREGITPDLALAHTWYEKARDLGSPDARDRISRLALLPP
jgi:hypothetical protein